MPGGLHAHATYTGVIAGLIRAVSDRDNTGATLTATKLLDRFGVRNINPKSTANRHLLTRHVYICYAIGDCIELWRDLVYIGAWQRCESNQA